MTIDLRNFSGNEFTTMNRAVVPVLVFQHWLPGYRAYCLVIMTPVDTVFKGAHMLSQTFFDLVV